MEEKGVGVMLRCDRVMISHGERFDHPQTNRAGGMNGRDLSLYVHATGPQKGERLSVGVTQR
jgi:hypothetical protein